MCSADAWGDNRWVWEVLFFLRDRKSNRTLYNVHLTLGSSPSSSHLPYSRGIVMCIPLMPHTMNGVSWHQVWFGIVMLANSTVRLCTLRWVFLLAC